jgi:photoactive yellow protein
MQVLRFGTDDIDNILAAEPERVDRLPFGAILLDPDGRILKYNRMEAGFAGRRVEDVIGRSFFDEVAPCSKGQIIYHRFFRAVSEGKCNIQLDYAFEYGVTPCQVRVHLKSEDTRKGIWMFIKRL